MLLKPLLMQLKFKKLHYCNEIYRIYLLKWFIVFIDYFLSGNNIYYSLLSSTVSIFKIVFFYCKL